MKSQLRRFLQNQSRDTRGSTTVELVVWIPLFLFIFMLIFEYGYGALRYAFLERAARIVAREIAIDVSQAQFGNEDDVKKAICDRTLLYSQSNCLDSVGVEFHTRDPFNWTPLPATFSCEGTGILGTPNSVSSIGSANELQIMRVCLELNSIFPTTGLSWGTRLGQSGKTVLGVSTVYVIEIP